MVSRLLNTVISKLGIFATIHFLKKFHAVISSQAVLVDWVSAEAGDTTVAGSTENWKTSSLAL